MPIMNTSNKNKYDEKIKGKFTAKKEATLTKSSSRTCACFKNTQELFLCQKQLLLLL